MGKYACYVFCLIDIAEEVTGKTFDVFREITEMKDSGFIDFNESDYSDTGNFYVRDPCGILKQLTDKEWSVSKQPSDYGIRDGDYAVEFWSVNGSTGHFARTYKGFNSLQKSVCVSKGSVRSYRIFRLVKS